MAKNRRMPQIITISFLDLMVNFAGACILLLCLSMTIINKLSENKPCVEIPLNANVYFDREKSMLWDTLDESFKNLKPGDKVIVTVEQLKSIPGGIRESGSSYAGSTNDFDCSQCPARLERCTLPHFPPNCPDAGKCAIAATPTTPKCSDNGTPNLATDDTYTFDVTMTRLGDCASTWSDQFGRTGNYGLTAHYGPFPISGGGKELMIKDLNKPDASVSVKISAPTACSVNVPPAGSTGTPSYPGSINIVVLFDEEKGHKVSLSVEKGRKKCGHRKANEPSIGEWGNDKNRIINPPKTGIQYVRQYGTPIEGDYEIYGTCINAPTGGVGKATLHVLSKTRPGTSITQVFPNLRLDEKVLLMKIHISTDGSIRRIN